MPDAAPPRDEPARRGRSRRGVAGAAAAVALSAAVFAPLAPAQAKARAVHGPRQISVTTSDITGVVGKPKIVVTTDPEKDDQNSLIRYLLMSDEFDTKGLIVSSSEYHWAGDGKGTEYFFDGAEYTHFPKYIPDPCPCTHYRWPTGPTQPQLALAAYKQVYQNLAAQAPGYPTPASLEKTYRVGNIAYQGDMGENTPGSNLIEHVLLHNDPRTGPVFLLAWGGDNTIARALEQIQLTYQHTKQWPAIYKKVSAETIIQSSGEQDATIPDDITPNWPDIRINTPVATGGKGGYMDYGGLLEAIPSTLKYYSAPWMEDNIIGKGPFGRLYYSWGDGRQLVKGDPTDFFWLAGKTTKQLKKLGYYVFTPPEPKGSFLGEGDDYTYLNLLSDGMRDDQNLSWGEPNGGRYFPMYMNEEAARLDWSLTPDRRKVNHDPVVKIDGPLAITAAPGATVNLSTTATDPDGNSLGYDWYEDTMVDSYKGTVTPADPTAPGTTLTVPTDAKAGQTINMLVAVTDSGTPPLTQYGRVVVTVK